MGGWGWGGESCDPFSISPSFFEKYFFESVNFKLILHFYAREMILMFGCFLFLSKRKINK